MGKYKESNVINLNQVCKIILNTKKKTKMCSWVEEICFVDWFLNLFRKKKVSRTKYIEYYKNWFRYRTESVEEFENDMGDRYYLDKVTQEFYEKPSVRLQYSNDSIPEEIRYFDTITEAKSFFDKLLTCAHENGLCFIDFYA